MRNFQPKQIPEPNDGWYTPLPIQCNWGIYARQSTPAQLVKHQESTEMQTVDLIKWLVERQVKRQHIALFDADLGLSGTLRIDQRTGLQELVEHIKTGEIKAVLVYQISRLFRDETGVQYNVFANICKQHHCLLVTSDGTIFNFNNPMHLKMFRFLAEMAAEYIPQQIGLLHAAKIRKARKGKYAGLGAIPSGYIVDRCKDSSTFEKFIPYEPHAIIVLYIFQRYFELEGNLFALCNELNELPVLFPSFTPDVDSRTVNKCLRKKVTGGYHISRTGVVQLLTNPIYIGWWVVQGDIIRRENHEPIIDHEHEYLFWYAFNRLSDYTVEGKVNTERGKQPRRFYQNRTIAFDGLLKDKIASSNGSVFVHLYRNRCRYIIRPTTTNTLVPQGINEIDATLIDEAFCSRLFTHLRETHDFDVYKKWLAEETQKQSNLVASVTEQLAEIEKQQEAILDEKLAIHKQLRQISSDEERAKAEQETQPDLERLRKRSVKLEKATAELTAKLPKPEENQELQNVRKYADFQTELEKLALEWDSKPFQKKKEFVNVLVKNAVLDVVAPHWIRLEISWIHPHWQDEVIYQRKHAASYPWLESERDIIRLHYGKTPREELLQLLPNKTWGGIKTEAGLLRVQRTVAITHSIIPHTITWLDWQFMIREGIEPNQYAKYVTLSI